MAELRSDPATRDCAIVLVTGHEERLSAEAAAEADAVVRKPFDVPELLAIVHRAVQRAATRRQEVAPVAATSHREAPARSPRLAQGVRRSRPRR
jgi:DNA-binding NtrC family response regulator